MLKRRFKLFLVSTSMAPVLLSLGFVAWRTDHLYWALTLLCGVELLLRLTTGLLGQAKRQLELVPIALAKVKTSDREVMGFMLAYVAPIALASGTVISVDPYALAYLLSLFGLVVWGMHAYDFNPLLGLMGYHFFEVETDKSITYIMITKREIVSVQQITEVVQLTEYVLLDSK